MRENTSPDVFVCVEGMQAPSANFTESNFKPRLPDSTYAEYISRCERIARVLVEKHGLTNVFMNIFLDESTPLANYHYPDYAEGSPRLLFRFRVTCEHLGSTTSRPWDAERIFRERVWGVKS